MKVEIEVSKNWDKWLIGLAKYISTRSKDPSTKVGAVIVNDDKNIISMGYNGFPRGVEDDENRLYHREEKYDIVLHAEENAILNANGQSLKDTTIYTYPLSPCSLCASRVIQSGVRRVCVPSHRFLKRFDKNHEKAFRLFEEANVEVVRVNMV